ncbi:MAG: hypothetical protein ACRC80_12455, partial [Waterburya sp.]
MLNKLDLVVEIEELLEGCGNYPFGGDYYERYPCELITSPFIENGKFTIENFLLWQEFIEPITWEEFSSDVEIEIAVCEDDYPEIAKQYQDFLDFLQNKLQNTQIYKVKLKEIKEENKQFDEAYFYCLIGLTINDYWLGITPSISDEYYYGSSNSLEVAVKSNIKVDKIVNKLRLDFQESFRLLDKSVDSSGGDYKVEVINNRNLILEKLLDSGCYCWIKNFQPDLRYKIGGKLGKLLVDNLLEVKQYRIWGYDGLFIYSGGIAEDGD